MELIFHKVAKLFNLLIVYFIFFIGNLDEKLTERVLYEILVQAGRIVDMYIPRDKETNRHKGYAITEYDTKEITEYVVKLFTNIVSFNKKPLKFGVRSLFLPFLSNLSSCPRDHHTLL